MEVARANNEAFDDEMLPVSTDFDGFTGFSVHRGAERERSVLV